MKKNTLTRRNFVLAAAAAAGASWFDAPKVLAAANITTDKPFGCWPMGIQSFSLRHFDVKEAMDRAAALGLGYMEFWPRHNPVTQDRDAIAAFDREMAKRGIIVSAHGVHHMGDDPAALENLFWYARMAGIRVLTANPAPESFPIIDKLVKQFNIRIAIHNHGPGARYDTVEDCLNAAADYDKRIGYCVDTGHYMRSGVDPIEACRQLGDRLYGIHVKDYASAGKDAQEVIAGEGLLDLKALFKTLRDVRFPADGALSLEYELNHENPDADLRQGLANITKALKEIGV